MNKKGKIIGLSLVAIMVVSLFAVAIPSVVAIPNGGGKPDLIITNIWTVGNRIHYTIENIGGDPAPLSRTGLYIDGIYRAPDTVDPLAPGAASNEVFGSYNYRGGDIEVCADYRGRVDELNEDNNCNVLGPEPMPDLIITEKNETPLDDCRFNVTYTVENIGNGDANASNTTIYIDNDNKWEDPVPELAAGDHHTNTVGPFNCTPCQPVQVKVEADNDKNVTESNENNNERVNVFKCPGPDLKITSKSEEALDDCRFNVTYTVQNIGNCKANASNTTIYINYGVEEMEDPVPELAAGEPYTSTVGPFNCTPCESVEVKVEADNNDNVTECNEDNNEKTNTYVCPGPDLIISDKYETALDNCTFTVTYTVKNIGECNASASNTTIYINDIEQMKDPVGELAKDASVTHEVGPFSCTPCTTLTITVKADNDGDVVECEECNNWKINEFKCPAPDLVITEKSEEINEDNCTFTVTYTVKNRGNCKANASDTTIYINGVNKMEDPAGELAAGEPYTNTVGPFSCEPCTTLNITVKADNNDDVKECNESNNVKENEFKCPAPDLTITAKSETALDNCSFTVTYTVENIGNCNAGASNTTIYINNVIVSVDPVGPLPSGGCGYSHTNTVGPFSCEPCTNLTIKVEADNYNVVKECNETNNVKENEFKCPAPDLIIADKHETALDNCSFTVTYTVENIGNCNASASDTTIYIDDVNVLEDPVGELAAGGTYTNTVGPFSCTSCDILNITVEADNNNDVTECNETNNNMTNTYVCPGPDLIVFDKYETALGDGSFNVTYTVKNIGNCNAGASNTTITVDGTATEYPAPALSSDQCYKDTVGPFDCTPCMTVTVTVKADNDDDVTECNETNNEKTNTFVCPGPGPGKPDLVITDIEVVDNRIHYTIQNIGGEPAPKSRTGLYINGRYRSPDQVKALGIGAHSNEVFGSYNYRGGDIEVCADYNRRIDEANEGNNCMVDGGAI